MILVSALPKDFPCLKLSDTELFRFDHVVFVAILTFFPFVVSILFAEESFREGLLEWNSIKVLYSAVRLYCTRKH